MIVIIATVKTTPEHKSAVVEASRRCIEKTRKEPGCLRYDIHESVTEPDTFVTIEHWSDRPAVLAHFTSEHLSTWRSAVEDLVTERKVEIISGARIDDLASFI